MKRLLAMAGKEWKQFRRDRLTLALAVALPVVLMTLYGTALTTNVRNLRLAIQDLDHTPLSRRYVEAYAATNKFVLVEWPEGKPLARLLEDGTARAVLRIGPGFERDYWRGTAPEVQLVVDGTDTNSAVVLRNIGAAVSRTFRAGPVPASDPEPPVLLQTRFWYNPGLSDAKYFGSGALAMVLVLFPALLGAIAVSREVELGTVAQAYASTLSAPEWVIGKALPYWLVGAAQLVLLFLYGVVLFGYRLPSQVGPLLAASGAYLAAAVLFGMMLGNLTGSQAAAIQATQLGAFLLSLLLSGFLVPVSNIPVELRWISMLIPARHYVEVVRDAMLRDGGWVSSARQLACLGGLALLFFAVNVRRMRRMQFSG
jgi:ABC-2 type transport system permease protein